MKLKNPWTLNGGFWRRLTAFQKFSDLSYGFSFLCSFFSWGDIFLCLFHELLSIWLKRPVGEFGTKKLGKGWGLIEAKNLFFFSHQTVWKFGFFLFVDFEGNNHLSNGMIVRVYWSFRFPRSFFMIVGLDFHFLFTGNHRLNLNNGRLIIITWD